jgi:hypothetical protein
MNNTTDNTSDSTAQLQSKMTIHAMYAQYGRSLQCMTYEQKIVMRAALSGFIAQRPVWKEEGSSISCIDCCIESAGADWGIWDEDEDLCRWISDYSQLPESEIEDLIAALTVQIRGKVYSSRSV